MAKITIDGITKEYPQGTAFEEIARQYQPGFKDMIALVAENRKIRELHKKVQIQMIGKETEVPKDIYDNRQRRKPPSACRGGYRSRAKDIPPPDF